MKHLEAPRTRLLARERLIERLERSLAGRGAVLIAGRGFGKTTLLDTFVARTSWQWLWCDLGDFHGEALAWVRQLLDQVERLSPRLQPRQIERLQHNRATVDDALATIDLLTAAHRRLPGQPILLVIDDADRATTGSEIERCLHRLCDRLPPAWRIFVAGHGDTARQCLFRLARVGQVELLDQATLAFTIEETKEALHGLASAGQIDALQAATAGWPAAIGLVAQCRCSGGLPDSPDADETSAYHRLARAMLARFDPTVRSFLIRSSVLPYLEPGLCDAALGQSGSANSIERLVADNLLSVRRHYRTGTYRYHSLLRDILLAELASTLPPEEIRAIGIRAAQYLVRNGQVDRAAELMIDAADWTGFADLLAGHGEALIYSGKTTRILRWLDRIPAETAATSPWMLFYRARCCRLLDRAGDLRSIQQRAEALFIRLGNWSGRAAALLEQAKDAERSGQVSEAAALCVEALQVVGDDPIISNQLQGSLISYYTMLGRLDEAIRLGCEAIAWLSRIPHPETRAVYETTFKRRIGVASAFAGNYDQALTFLAEACTAGAEAPIDERTLLRNLYYRGFVEGMRGEFDRAFTALDQAERMARDYGLSLHTLRIGATRAELLATIGQFEAARRQFRQVGWFSNDMGDAGYFYYRIGDLERATSWYETEIARTGAASHPINRARAQALLGACLAAAGNPASARLILEQSLAVFRRCGFGSRVPGIQLHLADIAFSERRETEGFALLKESFGAARTSGTTHFFALEPGVLRRSLRRARVHAIEPAYIDRVEAHWNAITGSANPAIQWPSVALPDWQSGDDSLDGCTDDAIRSDLIQALDERSISPAGIRALRTEYGLTWREIQIFVRYYLTNPDDTPPDLVSSRRRLDLAMKLGVTEFTLRHHITTIRGKLGLSGQRSLGVYQWAINRRIVASA